LCLYIFIFTHTYVCTLISIHILMWCINSSVTISYRYNHSFSHRNGWSNEISVFQYIEYRLRVMSLSLYYDDDLVSSLYCVECFTQHHFWQISRILFTIFNLNYFSFFYIHEIGWFHGSQPFMKGYHRYTDNH
jgi:hypothetical protein